MNIKTAEGSEHVIEDHVIFPNRSSQLHRRIDGGSASICAGARPNRARHAVRGRWNSAARAFLSHGLSRSFSRAFDAGL